MGDPHPEPPSTDVSGYWQFDMAEHVDYPSLTPRSGKWVAPFRVCEIDQAWARTRELLHAGRLGNCAKVATALENPNAYSKDERVILVYCYDEEDQSDVARIEAALWTLKPLRLKFKSDAATARGEYANRRKRTAQPSSSGQASLLE